MDLGKQIRILRLSKGLTQEQLSEKMRVSPQAVSKWENGSTMPDIQLLPELSIFFGVTIDELFQLTDESHYNRIESMIENEWILAQKDFDYAERFLKERLMDEQKRGKSLTLLGDLYNCQADGYHSLGKQYALQALEAEPEKKDNHLILSKASNGVMWDWNYTNHHQLIDYYYTFVQKHPKYVGGYMWLLDNLIFDHRLEEAETVLAQMQSIAPSYHGLMYQGYIANGKGDLPQAEALWQQMVDQYPATWLAFACRGDAYAKLAMYDKAISDYEKAIELAPTPRYTDNYEAIAHIHMIRKNNAGAIDAYQHIVEILINDWHITEGETIDGYRQNIAQLKGDA